MWPHDLLISFVPGTGCRGDRFVDGDGVVFYGKRMKFLWHSLLGIPGLSFLQFKWLNSLASWLFKPLTHSLFFSLSLADLLNPYQFRYFDYLNLRQELCTLNFANLMLEIHLCVSETAHNKSEGERERQRESEWEAAAWQNISIACWHFINAAHSLIEAVVNLWWWCLLLLLLLLLYLPILFTSLPTFAVHFVATRPQNAAASKWVFVYSECRPRRTAKWTTNMAPDGSDRAAGQTRHNAKSWNVTQKGKQQETERREKEGEGEEEQDEAGTDRVQITCIIKWRNTRAH